MPCPPTTRTLPLASVVAVWEPRPVDMAPVLAQVSVNIGWSILLTAALSFVGAGVRPPTPEWGSMIAMGFQNLVTGQWWPSVFSALEWR